MKKKAGMWLILLLLIFIMTGCGTSESTSETTDKEDADKLQIGLSFDSFVIERWLRDRDMFVSTAQGLNAEVNVIERLRLYYKQEDLLWIESDGPGTGISVHITLPKEKEENQ